MFSDTANLLTAVGAGAALVLSATAILAGIFFSSKSKGQQQSIEALGATNEAMEQALRFERDERKHDQATCDENIAHLRGQLDVMQRQQVDTLMAQVSDAMTRLAATTLDRMEDGLKLAVKDAVTQGVAAGVRAAREDGQ